MIRNGNHFVLFGKEWCLIDGPWFRYLESLRRGCFAPIMIDVSPVMPLRYIDGPPEPPFPKLETVCWQPRMWHPGSYSINKFLILKYERGKLPDLRTVPELQRRWDSMQQKRLRIGFMALPDGRLPPYIDLFELPEDEYEIEDLIEQEERIWRL